MSKIHVIPAEGFEVRDHKGNVIPAGGAEVEESPVIEARLREGLLTKVYETLEDAQEDLGADLEAIVDFNDLTREQLAEMLTAEGIEFAKTASKKALVALAEESFPASEEDGESDEAEGEGA